MVLTVYFIPIWFCQFSKREIQRYTVHGIVNLGGLFVLDIQLTNFFLHKNMIAIQGGLSIDGAHCIFCLRYDHLFCKKLMREINIAGAYLWRPRQYTLMRFSDLKETSTDITADSIFEKFR